MVLNLIRVFHDVAMAIPESISPQDFGSECLHPVWPMRPGVACWQQLSSEGQAAALQQLLRSTVCNSCCAALSATAGGGADLSRRSTACCVVRPVLRSSPCQSRRWRHQGRWEAWLSWPGRSAWCQGLAVISTLAAESVGQGIPRSGIRTQEPLPDPVHVSSFPAARGAPTVHLIDVRLVGAVVVERLRVHSTVRRPHRVEHLEQLLHPRPLPQRVPQRIAATHHRARRVGGCIQ
jgi:hypothetical protein